MLIGLLPDSSKTEILLNNLSEADFDLADISVIMQDLKQRKAIARDAGPWKGIRLEKINSKLIEAGLSAEQAEQCVNQLRQGMVLVVMQVSQESLSAAREMFQDHNAQIIKE